MEQLLTRQEAAKRLGISLVTLDEIRAARLIAFVQRKPGAKVFFRQDAIDAYLARCTQPARPEQRIGASGTYRKRRVVR